ncbi:MAG: RNA methyltransferase [Pseudomonadota bacterium]
MKTLGKHTSQHKGGGASKPPRKPQGKPHRKPGAGSGARQQIADSRGAKRYAQNKDAGASKAAGPDRLFVYGVHTVRAALLNPKRTNHRLYATANGLERIADALPNNLDIREVESRDLQRMVGSEPVHQGLVLECAPLDALDPSELFHLADHDLLLVLDQVTDPHNVGAILRSAVALAAGAVITTARHAAGESAVLAKSASGAVDMIDQMPVRNLSKTIDELTDMGFLTLGLDSEGAADMATALADPTAWNDRRLRAKPRKIAIVLGAEGKGLRAQTRDACHVLARLDMPGQIRSLNVSNAAVLALYLARATLTSSNI